MKEIHYEIRDMRNGEYAYIHKIVLDDYGKQLGATGIAIYTALAYFANYATQGLFPSQKQIAEKARCSRMQVSRIVKEMEELGLVTKEPRVGHSSMYYLTKAKCICGKHPKPNPRHDY